MRFSSKLILPTSAIVAAFLLALIPANSQTNHATTRAKPTRVNSLAASLDYNRDIRPILASKCFACHGSDEKARQAGLRLDLKSSAVAKLGSGRLAIVPGNAKLSEVVQRINATGPTIMPPAGSQKTLSVQEKQLITRWIAEGAEYKLHWAFVKPVRPSLPLVHLKTWPRNGIDAFILARLEKAGLKPSPFADRPTLIRRLSLDLIGIPPTLAEVDDFLADHSPNAYETVVDRLLSSPHYGERMALNWLDGARYADSNGYQADYERFQWRWRDWVLDAFNSNMPFDEFTVEQIAGDMLPNATMNERLATGFNRNHRINTEGGSIPEEWRTETVIDRVETTSAVWLGLTMGCGRCHDHKYDPITQKEFYEFCSFFNNVPETGTGQEAPINHPPIMKAPTIAQQAGFAILESKQKKLEARRKELDAADADKAAQWLAKVEGTVTVAPTGPNPDPLSVLLAVPADKRTSEQKSKLAELLAERNDPEYKQNADALAAAAKEHTTLDGQVMTAMVMEEMPKPRDCYVLTRGQYDKHGEPVTAGLPAAFPPMPAGAPMNRLGLARWIASADNPLTARVAVNRMWEKFFGTGLVSTSEDFGTRAEFPSHPELLEWLATEFVRLKWDMKAMQKEIVMSAAYMQTSKATPELMRVDPLNRLISRGPRYRLPAEEIRDQALAVSGLLVEKIGGPSVRPYQPDGIWDETNVYGNMRNYKHDTGENLYRRSIYTIWKRTAAPPTMTLFDVPGRETCRVRRTRTDTPLQALVLLNETTFVEAARVLAQRTLTQGGTTPEARVTFAFRSVLSRNPTPHEAHILLTGLNRRLAMYRADPKSAEKLVSIGDYPREPGVAVTDLAAYTVTASVLLNMDEAINKE